MQADDHRINGWKAIGSFLGRDRTTAIRWSNERGLPVHRVPGGRTGTVYALRGELTEWMANGGSATRAAAVPAKEPEPEPPTPPTPPTPAMPARPGRRLAYGAVALGCALPVLALLSWRTTAPAEPPVSIAVAASRVDDRATAQFARDLTADLARFANASAGLAVLDKDGGAAKRAEYNVRTDIEGSATGRIVRVWLTSTRDGAILWSRRIAQTTSETVVLRERVAANVIGILRCGFSMLVEERAKIGAQDLMQLLSACQAVLDGDYAVAVVHARALVKARPDLATSWATLAVLRSGHATEGGEGQTLQAEVRSYVARAAAIAPDHLATQMADITTLDPTSPAVFTTTEKALKLHPDEPKLLRMWSMMLFTAGYVGASVEPALRAMESDPTWMYGRDLAVRRLAAAGRIDDAVRVQRENERLWPGHPAVVQQGAWLAVEAAASSATMPGQPARATAASRPGGVPWAATSISSADRNELERLARAEPSTAYTLVRVEERAGNRRAALDWLARAPVIDRSQQQWALLFWPAVAALRTEPAFFEKMAQLGLLRVWLTRKQWPDFCADPALKYDCATEALKFGAAVREAG